MERYAWVERIEVKEMKISTVLGDDVLEILSMMQHPEITWALFHDPPPPTYSEKRICLQGNAAHASTSH